MFQYTEDTLIEASNKIESKQTNEVKELFLRAKEKITDTLVYSTEFEDLKKRYPGYTSFLEKGAKLNGLHDELCIECTLEKNDMSELNKTLENWLLLITKDGQVEDLKAYVYGS